MGEDWKCLGCGFIGRREIVRDHLTKTGHYSMLPVADTLSGVGAHVTSSEDEDDYIPVPSKPKTMITREQYEQARAVLDALPSGFYVKCDKCQGWFINSMDKLFLNNGGVVTCKDGCS